MDENAANREHDEVKEILDEHAKRRRALLKNATKVAVIAPAMALVLSAGSKTAYAGYTTTNSPTTSTTPDI